MREVALRDYYYPIVPMVTRLRAYDVEGIFVRWAMNGGVVCRPYKVGNDLQWPADAVYVLVEDGESKEVEKEYPKPIYE